MADTIAAIATAPSSGAIGILRLSGENVLSVVKTVFQANNNLAEKPRSMVYGDMYDKSGNIIDHGLAVYMKAPHSYTGEDTVELFCHGSLVVQKELLAALYFAGARPAQPGEFTRRAFLNGKMDLVQAEAVIDLIDSETICSARNAAAQMQGGIGKKLVTARDQLIDIAASFYAYVDYPDEEIDEISKNDMIAILCSVAQKFKQLIDTFDQGRIIKEGVRCAILGRPNAGKSSVLNALLGFERSIVSNIPGTTRDTIEEKIKIGEIVLHLVDTAGLRTTVNEIEQIGVQRAYSAAETAELILAVFDGSVPLQEEDIKVIELTRGCRTIAIVNKNDLELCADINKILDIFGKYVCIVSAQQNVGFNELRKKIAEMFDIEGIPCNGEVVTNARHRQALATAHECILRAVNVLTAGFTPDIAVVDIEAAINSLGEITGQTASEQVIGRIFERFCVGK